MSQQNDDLSECLKEGNLNYVVADNFYGIINASKHNTTKLQGLDSPCRWQQQGRFDCVIFLQKNESRQQTLWKEWPQVKINGSFLLYIPKKLTDMKVTIFALGGKNCSDPTASCKCGNFSTKTVCKDKTGFDENVCMNQVYNDKYMINMTTPDTFCVNCDNPVKKPDETIQLNTTFVSDEGEVDSSKAVKLMAGMGDLISKMNGTSAELSAGKGIEGVIVRKTNPKELDEVSFAYMDPKDKLKIVEDAKTLETFSRSISVSKEAFEKVISSNITIPYAAVLRFLNMTRDEKNSTILADEVVAIEMGAEIKNLTEKIGISFKNVILDKQFPNCGSWNGEGSKPNWTLEGCETIVEGQTIKCRCSHLTFFAVLLTPINETISSSDLKTLTMITQVGCGASVFFLGIILFMYFLIRKTKASTATQILIHLIGALFLLNFTFLVNHSVADLKSPVGCEVMAAVMHYSMLATFSWFAAQGFHLCLQLYSGGNITITRYVLKVAVFTWALPGIAVIVLGSLRKYGEQIIYTDNPENNVAMCWITDNNVHYIVNIGYYSLVFIFTFITVIITTSWLFCLKRTKSASPQENRSGTSIVVILGLCCQLGVTWGFAFFAYGSFRVAATYIFTILNSFQGFFLFIYYFKTTRVGPGGAAAKGGSGSTNSSVSTLKSGLESVVNPYVAFEKGKGM
ncbi:adhesion G-protein coupled receptor G5-like [Fundulus diaphanus]